MMKATFLVLAGDGINCERESARALEAVGAQARIVHVNDLLKNSRELLSYQGLIIPGGFSFGDELGSGLILATKIKHQLNDSFREFVAQKRPILGICNGFQVLTKLGLLPFPFEERSAALAHNASGHFMNRWSSLEIPTQTRCQWLAGLEGQTLDLPVRHGEGRLLFQTPQVLERVKELGLIALRYKEDINGSTDRIAGLTDPSGMILGMMPHPEAYMFQATAKNPRADYQSFGDGAKIFMAMMNYLKNS